MLICLSKVKTRGQNSTEILVESSTEKSWIRLSVRVFRFIFSYSATEWIVLFLVFYVSSSLVSLVQHIFVFVSFMLYLNLIPLTLIFVGSEFNLTTKLRTHNCQWPLCCSSPLFANNINYIFVCLYRFYWHWSVCVCVYHVC